MALVGAVVAAFGWMVWSVMAVPAPLSYDEAVYTSHARHLLEGTPDTTWRPHRAPALPALGMLVQQVTGSERGFRLVGLAFGVVALLGVRWLARMIARTPADSPGAASELAPAVAALVAMGMLALAPPVVESAARFLTDLPAAGVLALAAGVLWRSFEPHRTPTWGLLAAPPLLASAFYLRFGSALFVALLLLVAGVLWWDRARRNPAPVISAGGLLVVLLLPHMVLATREFGAPWGRVLHTTRVVAGGMEQPAEGLLGYLRLLPFDLAGPVAGPAMIAGGICGAVVLLGAVARGRWSAQERAWTFLAVPAIAHVALIGWRAPADVRFLYPALMFLAVAAGLAVHRAFVRLGRRNRTLRRGAAAVTATGAVSAVIVGLVPVVATNVVAGRASYARKFQTVQAVALEIDEHSEADCFVVTSYAAQVLWYSGCGTARFQRVGPGELTGPEIVVGDERFDTDTRWVALFDRGTRQPDEDELAGYLDVTSGEPEVWVRGARRMAWGAAYRVDRASVSRNPAPLTGHGPLRGRRPAGATDVFRGAVRSLPP